jgi:hypothetical protein
MKNIDLTQPFVAIRNDLDGDDFTATMGEYLCNPLAEDLADIRISLGGFYSADPVGVIESLPNEKRLPLLGAGEANRFALSTWDEYCEMVVHWSVRYTLASGSVRLAEFSSFKGLADAQHFDAVPCLLTAARVVPGTTSEA